MVAAAERLRLSALPGIEILTCSIEDVPWAVDNPLASLPNIATQSFVILSSFKDFEASAARVKA
jgi:hypothetical protein